MREYPEWWDKTVTLYHRTISPNTHLASWQRTVIENCFWKKSRAAAQTNLAEYGECSVTARIPIQEITIEKNDILILGETDDLIDEYENGKRSSDLLERYADRAARVNSITVNTPTGISCHHIRIGGI